MGIPHYGAIRKSGNITYDTHGVMRHDDKGEGVDNMKKNRGNLLSPA